MKGLDLLRKQLEFVKPEIIIAFGNYSLWALTEDNFQIGNDEGYKIPTGITSWRGSQLYTRPDMGGFKLVPTYHPAAIMRQWKWKATAKHDISSRAMSALNGRWIEPKYNFLIRPSFKAVMDCLDFLTDIANINLEKLDLAVDLETPSGFIDCLGLAWSSTDAICIPFTCVENKEGYWSPQEEKEIIYALRDLMLHPRINIIGQNFSYDLQFFALYWVCLPPTAFDTMIAQHLLWPGTPKGLSYISSLYNRFHRHWKEEGKTWNKTIPQEVHWSYNCKDCIATWEAKQELWKLIQTFGLEDQFAEQMDFMDMAVDMMLRGVAYDTALAPKMSLELAEAQAQYETFFEAVIPWKEAGKGKPWWRSPKKQMEVFYDELGVQVFRHKKTKQPTADKEALDKIAAIEPLLKPIVEHLHEYRSAGVFQSNFIQMKLDPDQRARCTYDPTGTETFRWNSKKNAFDRGANFQAIPEGDE